MDSYEYTTSLCTGSPMEKEVPPECIKAMNEMGARGWELVSVTPKTSSSGVTVLVVWEWTLFWKRRREGQVTTIEPTVAEKKRRK